MKRKHYYHVKYHPGGIWMRLYNFSVNRWDLQPDHKLWLDDLAVPFLNEKSAHTFALIGMTSQTGPEAHNRVLSERRAKEVLQYLTRRLVGSQLDSNIGLKAMGEVYAENNNPGGNSEDPYFRAVEVWLLNNVLRFDSHQFARPLPEDYGMA